MTCIKVFDELTNVQNVLFVLRHILLEFVKRDKFKGENPSDYIIQNESLKINKKL